MTTSVCPFAAKAAGAALPETNTNNNSSVCPRMLSPSSAGVAPGECNNQLQPDPDPEPEDNTHTNQTSNKDDNYVSSTLSPKCPLGYDSQSFKLGPLSCVICKALLFQSSKCVPCSHKFCKACISRFKDCPLCGADIERIEPDEDLQSVVDRFIEGHARIKRPQVNVDSKGVASETNKVIYADVSLDRGAFLVQQAMRAFRSHNIPSAKSRLIICAEDIREQIERLGYTSEFCSQLGAVLGMLGDCCRAMEDSSAAVTYFEESVEFLSKLPTDDLEVTHTLSVSLNKIGDLKYYDGDLQTARLYYSRSLEVRKNALKVHSNLPSQSIDVAISLAKVADVDRGLGNESKAVEGFKEAIKCLESLTLSEATLERRRESVLEYLHSQLSEAEKEPVLAAITNNTSTC